MNVSPVQSRRRDALLCAALIVICTLAAYPVSGEGYLDDFSYAKTALELARTGHILYNGWAAPTQGWQIFWGALFIKLFGFSFTALRFAMLPFSAGCVYLFHRILSALGISRRNASIGALTLGLSPLFFPVAVSFMTDVPGLFVLLLCLYMCLRAIAAPAGKTAVLWIASAAAMSLAGATVRQTSWLGVLVMLPSTGWFLRKRRGVLPAALLGAVANFIALLVLMRWVAHQPYMFAEPTTQRAVLRLFSVKHLAGQLTDAFLCLSFLTLPLLLGWCVSSRKLTRGALLRIASVLAAAALLLARSWRHGKADHSMFPWLRMTIERHPLEIIDQATGSSTAMPTWLRFGLSLFVVAAVLVMLEQILHWARRSQVAPVRNQAGVDAALWTLGPFTLVYFLLILPRGGALSIFDRYLICLLPGAIVLLLLLYQRIAGKDLPRISSFAIVFFAIYSTAGVHDFYAEQRAGDAAVRELAAAGIPRRYVSESFNSDGWFQLETVGHMHIPGTESLDGALNSQELERHIDPNCSAFLERLAPAMNPHFYIAISPTPCLAPTNFPPVSYTAWLPPFHRRQFIEQPKNPAVEAPK